MSEMVDRVGCAILGALPDEGIASDAELDAVARAAIEAMREPTREMRSRGYVAICEEFHIDRSGDVVLEGSDLAAWRAMIDAALGQAA